MANESTFSGFLKEIYAPSSVMGGVKPRINYIDLAKGFCILLVIFGHSTGPMGDPPYLLFNMFSIFRMPLYFFLSGLFFKEYENIVGFTKRKINKLLIPFLFWHLAFLLTVPLSKNNSFSISMIYDFLLPSGDPFNIALWFLFCLFLLNLLFYAVLKLSSSLAHNKLILFVCSILIGAIGFVLSRYNIHLFCKLETVFTAFPFFYLGYFANRQTSFMKVEIKKSYCLLIAVISFAICYMLATGGCAFRHNSYNVNFLQLYLGGATGILGILMISRFFEELPVVSFMGRYSIMILVTHLPIVYHISEILYRHISNWQIVSLISLLITSLLYLMLIPLMKKWLPHVLAQKDVIKI